MAEDEADSSGRSSLEDCELVLVLVLALVFVLVSVSVLPLVLVLRLIRSAAAAAAAASLVLAASLATADDAEANDCELNRFLAVLEAESSLGCSTRSSRAEALMNQLELLLCCNN